jgi:hypothetical protein
MVEGVDNEGMIWWKAGADGFLLLLLVCLRLLSVGRCRWLVDFVSAGMLVWMLEVCCSLVGVSG